MAERHRKEIPLLNRVCFARQPLISHANMIYSWIGFGTPLHQHTCFRLGTSEGLLPFTCLRAPERSGSCFVMLRCSDLHALRRSHSRRSPHFHPQRVRHLPLKHTNELMRNLCECRPAFFLSLFTSPGEPIVTLSDSCQSLVTFPVFTKYSSIQYLYLGWPILHFIFAAVCRYTLGRRAKREASCTL